jgi:hypothetical protein
LIPTAGWHLWNEELFWRFVASGWWQGKIKGGRSLRHLAPKSQRILIAGDFEIGYELRALSLITRRMVGFQQKNRINKEA